jgi:hypothetical protein
MLGKLIDTGLSLNEVLLIALSFVLSIIGAVGRWYMRRYLRDAGIAVGKWIEVGDEIRAAERYYQLARESHFPLWPLSSLACFVLSFLVAVIFTFVLSGSLWGQPRL